MNRKAFEVFGKICAEEDLMQNTTSYLKAEIRAGARRRRQRLKRAAACVVCLLLLFFFGGIFYRAYFTPVAYIDFDVNPSVELLVNRFGKVIASHAYNDEGQEILKYIDVAYISYREAVGRLLTAMGQEGYFREDALLCVTLQTDEAGREGDMLKVLQQAVAQSCREQGCVIPSDVYAVTKEVKHCATEKQLSPAKYLAIAELIEIDPEADFEACREHSVYELREMAGRGCGWQEGEKEHGEPTSQPNQEEVEDKTNQQGKEITGEPAGKGNSHGHGHHHE
ncbi:MAG: hypothetical protein K2N63_05210 [Lachnospiraceae bacterium]|nr:hypothetical protein [Lachnospiraceae bacterium]